MTPKADASVRVPSVAVPVIPAIPNLAGSHRQQRQSPVDATPESSKGPTNEDNLKSTLEAASLIESSTEKPTALTDDQTEVAAPKAAPKSWADLVRTKAANAASEASKSNTLSNTNGVISSKAASLAEALSTYNVKDSKEATKLAFLEPRGLVNTGNMCYMNSVRASLSARAIRY